MMTRPDHWPCETKTVTSYVAEECPKGFREASYAVKVLVAEWTFWEKAEFHGPADKTDAGAILAALL